MATFTNVQKNSSTFTNGSKNSSTFVNESKNSGGISLDSYGDITGFVGTKSFTNTNGNFLVVFTTALLGAVNSLTYGGVAMTRLITTSDAGGIVDVVAWTLSNPLKGSNELLPVLADGTDPTGVSATYWSASGCAQTQPHYSNYGVGRVANITTTKEGCWGIDYVTNAATTNGSGTNAELRVTGTGGGVEYVYIFDTNGTIPVGTTTMTPSGTDTYCTYIGLAIEPLVFENQSKNSSTWSNSSKNTSTWTNTSKS